MMSTDLSKQTTGLQIAISEVFGPTIQGEGPSIGRRAAFVRLGGCNLHCVWCDTAYTWDHTRFDLHKEISLRRPEDVVAEAAALNTDLIVISGGEPMLQARALRPMLQAWLLLGKRVEVETNGTIYPKPPFMVSQFNVSPKLTHSGNAYSDAIKLPALQAFAADPRTSFKFVCQSTTDLDEVAAICHDAHISSKQVYIMAEGRTWGEVDNGTLALVDEVIARGYNLTTRLHMLLWGSERGH